MYTVKLKDSIDIYYPSQYPQKISPAQRYRIEQFEDLLKAQNITVHSFPFISYKVYPIFFKSGFLFKKAIAILAGYSKRFVQLFSIYKYDLIFINREASPLGPPIFEWLYAKAFRKKIIYDFDDAIWMSTTSEANKIAHGVKAFWKIKYIIKWSNAVIGGNNYLCDFARKYNPNTFLIPTVVDTHQRFNQTANQDVELLTIGWTGSFSTMPYLEKLLPVLNKIANDLSYRFILISNKQPTFSIPNLEYVEWSELNEVAKLAECQIGLMPIPRDEWARGKCGFKIIQYMALGIVPIADDWGANSDIIENGKNGFLVDGAVEWEAILRRLLIEKQLRLSLSVEAKIQANSNYSVQSVFPKLLSVIKKTAIA